MKQQFLVGMAGTLRTHVYENNRKIVPSSATVTVYRPSSTDKLVDAAAMSIGADGLLSYGLSAGDNSLAAVDYRAVISYVHDGASYEFTLFYDVVRSKLVKVITDDDLIAELPQLRDAGWKVTGKAQGGSTTTIVDAGLRRYGDDYFTGGLAYSVDKDETRAVTAFDAASGTVTVEPFSAAITTDGYVLTRSYTAEIDRAFEKIEQRLSGLGARASLILDPYDLREVHIYLAVAEACKGLVMDDGGFWWEMWRTYEKKADEAFSTLRFKYDYGDDGVISGGETASTYRTVRAARR
ncbi:MAG TPA: hypothetical protein ENJ37_03890 [Deltaproteobacteria bacterium]|nr:hypothetical protein [Deltaproteobacteria bacterium]